MSTNFVINARSREDTGKGASRRLRRQSGEVPAIIYGGKKHAEKISILHKDITKALEKGESVPEEWVTYRQALRDITESYTSLEDVVWPTKPE